MEVCKYAVLGYALNNLGELLGEGAPEAERAANRRAAGKIGGYHSYLIKILNYLAKMPLHILM